MNVFLKDSWKDHNTIQVNQTERHVHITKAILHESLECSRSVRQSKGHLVTFAESERPYSKCCFLFIGLFDLHLPHNSIPTSHIRCHCCGVPMYNTDHTPLSLGVNIYLVTKSPGKQNTKFDIRITSQNRYSITITITFAIRLTE